MVDARVHGKGRLMEPALTVDEVAKSLRVHPNTVYSLIRSGELRAFRTGKGKSPYKVQPHVLKAYVEDKSAEPLEEVTAA